MTISTSLRPSAARRSPRSTSLFSRIAIWHALWVQRRQLTGLDSARLADMGLTKAQAAREAGRPFWDAPKHWRQ